MDFPLFGEMIVGGIKIKDGLFIGDSYAAQDIEFIFNNKITHIVNCSCKEVPNYFEAQGIEYLGVTWEESDTQILFDQKGHTIAIICEFIEKARKLGESVLVHSVKGQSRASCAICAYFMMKFRWGFYKTLEFLDSRRPDLEIRRNFFEQLKMLADKLASQFEVSNNWETIINDDPELEREELIIRNTFFNSKIENVAVDPNMYIPRKKSRSRKKRGTTDRKKRRVKWVDDKNKRRSVRTAVLPYVEKKLNLTHSREASSVRGILKTSRVRSELGRDKVRRKRELSEDMLTNKNITRTEPNRSVNNDTSGLTSASRGKRAVSNSKKREDSATKSGKTKRLLNDNKKKRKGMYQSNSSKRLDNKGKRGSTPRRRKAEADSRKKISSSFSRNKEMDRRAAPSYNRPPLAKKNALNSAIEKYKNEIGKKHRDSSKKKNKHHNKLEMFGVEENKAGNSNSTNIPDDSKDMKNKKANRPPSGKLSKLSSLQPRYKMDENVNHSNDKQQQNPSRAANQKLIGMISQARDMKRVFKGTLGQNYLNISANDRRLFKEKIASGKYKMEPIRGNSGEKHTGRTGMLLKNDAFKAQRIKTDMNSLFDFSKYSHFLKNNGTKRSSGSHTKKGNSGDENKLKKSESKTTSKSKRPNSAPIKDIKKKKEYDRKTGKIFKNLIPTYNKKSGKLMGKGLMRGHFFKGRDTLQPNSIYTGPVIKKKMLN